MAKDNGHCACFIVPEHLFQSLAQSDEVDDASRGLASKAIQQMQELDIANKTHDIPVTKTQLLTGSNATPNRKIYNLQWRTDLDTADLWRSEVFEIFAHELTHGIIQHTAPLIYEGQSGALNESLADVFGAMVEQYAKKQTAAEADWLIGEDLLLPELKGMALWSLKAPGSAYTLPGAIGKDIQPMHMSNLWRSPADKFRVHVNSGNPNHAFYLVAVALGGYSWEKAGQIWYKALTKGDLKPKCNFKEFADITVRFAEDYGSETVLIVQEAWKTVGVLEQVI